jgi:protein phosphatase
MLTAFGVTHAGRVRKTNEDSLFWDERHGVFLVADGMGGHNAGETASRLAVDTITHFLKRSRSGDDFTWPYGINPTLSFHANRLVTAIKLANRRVFKTGESRDEYMGLGTTVVVALVEDGELTYAGVGDSRIYRVLDGTLSQMTKDDSWVETLRSQQGLGEAALAAHPMRHVLTSVLGAREQLDVAVDERPLAAGERLLLSSDGLHGVLDAAVIADVLASDRPAQAMAETLVELALERDGGDNITALVVRADAPDS